MPGPARPIFVYPRSARKDISPLGHLDGRTRGARILKRTRDALIDHCGGFPSVTQLEIIERCCWLTLKLAILDGKIGAGKDTSFDNAQYLAWQAHLTRNLVKLGMQSADAKQPTLADVLSQDDAA
jgi:hypothetical protein